MTKERFDVLGVMTLQMAILGFTMVVTTEPENVKCVLASEFRSYSLGDARKRMLRPLLGEGIFTTDGKEWVLFSCFDGLFPLVALCLLNCQICEAQVLVFLWLFLCSLESLWNAGLQSREATLTKPVTGGSTRGIC